MNSIDYRWRKMVDEFGGSEPKKVSDEAREEVEVGTHREDARDDISIHVEKRAQSSISYVDLLSTWCLANYCDE